MTRLALAGTGTAQARYTVPKVGGDAAAAYRLAVAYQDLADAVQAAQRHVAVVIDQLSTGWHGEARQALAAPAEMFLHNAITFVGALEQAAGVYETYGRRLEKAHEHHKFSMHKLLKVGVVAAVTATAVVVTVGAAGVVEASAAAAAVGGASEAVGAAVTADVVAAGALETALESLAVLRPLLGFVLPQLLQVEWAVGSTAVYDEITTGQLRWRALAQTGAMAFVASGVAAKAVELADGNRWLPPVIEGSAWAGAAAADDGLTEHRFDVGDVAESFVFAGGSTYGVTELRARGWWPATPDYRRAALISLLHRGGRVTDPEIAQELALLRQPLKDFEHGRVDLRINEGPGHTLSQHVGRSTRQLLAQQRRSMRTLASTYWDEPGAQDAVQEALTTHRSVIQQWVQVGCPAQLRLHLSSDHDLGFVLDRHNRVRFVHNAVVVLQRDTAGVVLVTSHPVL